MLDVKNLDYASGSAVLFQRITVILGDALLALGAFSVGGMTSVVLVLWNSTLLMVDHVHFQYNGMLLGLLLLSIAAIERQRTYLGAVLFCLLLCMKRLATLTALRRSGASGSTAGFAEVYESAVLWSVPPKATFALRPGPILVRKAPAMPAALIPPGQSKTLLAYLPLLRAIWQAPERGSLSLYVALGSAVAFSFGWHVHEKAILMVTIPLLAFAPSGADRANPRRRRMRRLAETIVKWILFLAGLLVENWLLLGHPPTEVPLGLTTVAGGILRSLWPFSASLWPLVALAYGVLGIFRDAGVPGAPTTDLSSAMDERGSLLEPHHLADRADPSPRSAPLRRGLAACATAAALVAAVVLVLHARVLRAAERGSLRHDAERSSDGTGETLASLWARSLRVKHALRKLGLTEIPPGACHIHSGFCRGPDDRLEYHDCDGDDILDPYCVAFDKLSFGYISSKGNCRNNWPNGLCLNQDEPSIANAEKVVPALANEITIIHFNDVYEMAGVLKEGVHSLYDSFFPRRQDGTRKGGMSRAAYVIERARKRNPDRTLVVFAGDLLSPSVLSDLFQGRQAVDVLNYLNLTAASLGNHEFDFGVDVLRQRMQDSVRASYSHAARACEESKFPWLNLNLMDEHGRLLAGTQKHKIIDLPYAPRWSKDSLRLCDTPNTKTTRLCLFGVAYDLLQTLYKDKERLRYKDAQEAAVQEARELRKTHQCSVVLALTHQFAKDDCALAKAAGKDLDLILGGHDHFTDLRSDCGHATYLKADSDLKTQWVMTMMLDDEGFSESIEGKLLSLTDQDPFSPSVHEDKVVQWEERGQAELGKRIGCSTVPLDTRESQVRQQEMLGSATEAEVGSPFLPLRTDVVLIAGGTIRGNKVFPAGNLMLLQSVRALRERGRCELPLRPFHAQRPPRHAPRVAQRHGAASGWDLDRGHDGLRVLDLGLAKASALRHGHHERRHPLGLGDL
eukprot:g32144.t2